MCVRTSQEDDDELERGSTQQHMDAVMGTDKEEEEKGGDKQIKGRESENRGAGREGGLQGDGPTGVGGDGWAEEESGEYGRDRPWRGEEGDGEEEKVYETQDMEQAGTELGRRIRAQVVLRDGGGRCEGGGQKGR